MKKKPRFTALIVLFVGIFALWWGIAVLSEGSASYPNTLAAALQNNETVAIAYTPASKLTVHHNVAGDVNSYSGSLTLPSDCDLLGTGISVSGQDPMHVTLILTLVADAQCAQAPLPPSEQPFAVSASSAAGSAPIFDGVTLNGAIVPSSLVEGQ